jgi:ABC-type dipeptide transport system, periplasmic component
VLTFHLRDNVTFHSGNPLTAEDVVWSMRRILHLNLAQASVWKSYGFSKKNIDNQVSAPDPYTVQITLPKANDPQLVIYSLGALGNLGVLDSKTVQQHEANNELGQSLANHQRSRFWPLYAGNLAGKRCAAHEAQPALLA